MEGLDEMGLRYAKTNNGGILVNPDTGGWLFVDGMDDDLLIRDKYVFPEGHLTLSDKAKKNGYDFLNEDFSGSNHNVVEDGFDTIIIKLTNRCNQACKHCYDATGEPLTDIQDELLLKAARQSFEYYISWRGAIIEIQTTKSSD